MELHVALSDLMDAVDSESEFDDYGYFLDPATGVTHLLWDGEVDGTGDRCLFQEMAKRLDDFIKLPDRSMTDLYQRARDFLVWLNVDERKKKQLQKALRKAKRKRDPSIFLGEANALGLHDEQLAYWDACDESFVRQWCAENDIAVDEGKDGGSF